MIVEFNRWIEVTRTVVMAPSPTTINPWRNNMEGKVTAKPPENAGAISKLVITAPSITEIHDEIKTLDMNHFWLLFFLVNALMRK